jgi:hypothetical protein
MRRPTISGLDLIGLYPARGKTCSPRATPKGAALRPPERGGRSLGSSVRLRSVRARRAAAFVQELIQFGAILRRAEPLQEFLEVSFFIFEATQRFRTVLIERTIVAGRLPPPISRAAAAAGAVSHPVFPSTPSGVQSPGVSGELRPMPTAKRPAQHERDENDEPDRKPPNEPKDEENKTHDATCVQCECK